MERKKVRKKEKLRLKICYPKANDDIEMRDDQMRKTKPLLLYRTYLSSDATNEQIQWNLVQFGWFVVSYLSGRLSCVLFDFVNKKNEFSK